MSIYLYIYLSPFHVIVPGEQSRFQGISSNISHCGINTLKKCTIIITGSLSSWLQYPEVSNCGMNTLKKCTLVTTGSLPTWLQYPEEKNLFLTLQAYLIGIIASICSGRESWCLPYAGYVLQSGGAGPWRVCYQRGLPCLVS